MISSSLTLTPRANGRNIVGHQLSILLDVICCVRLPTILHVDLLRKRLATCKRTQQLPTLLAQKMLGVVASVCTWLKITFGVMKALRNDVSTELAWKKKCFSDIAPATVIYLHAAVDYWRIAVRRYWTCKKSSSVSFLRILHVHRNIQPPSEWRQCYSGKPPVDISRKHVP